jgi:hypothetical protein
VRKNLYHREHQKGQDLRGEGRKKESSMTSNEGRLFQQKEFHGRIDEGSYSFHSHFTARWNTEDELSRFRVEVDSFHPPHLFTKMILAVKLN